MRKLKTVLFISQLLLGVMALGQDTSVVSSTGFRTLFTSGNYHITYGSFNLAAPVFLALEQLDPGNANIQYKIGYCYLRFVEDKSVAIPYLQKAVKKAVRNYNDIAYTEKNAPERAYYELATAFHWTNQLDSAIKNFQKYIGITKEKHFMKEVAKRRMGMCEYAIMQMANPINVVITNLGDSINSSYEDFAPVLSADETKLIFTSRRKGSTGGINNLEFDDRFFEDIYISFANETGWTTPVRMGSGINGMDNDAVIGLSADGQMLFSHINGDMGDIYISYLSGTEWTSPDGLGPTINSIAEETQVSISANGKYLYFSRERPDKEDAKLKNFDLYVSSKLKDGSWSEAKNLGDVINTEGNENYPFIHPNGTRLYFSSTGHESMGGYDILYSDMLSDGTWSVPKNIGFPINTTKDDIYYTESADGKHAYYSSVNAEMGLGKSDIYRVELPDNPEVPLTMISGIVEVQLLDGIPKETIIYVVNLTTDEENVYSPNEESGEYLMILPAGSKYYISYEVGELIIAEENIDERKRTEYRHLSKFISKEGKIETTDLNKKIEEELAPVVKEDMVKKSLLEKYFGPTSKVDTLVESVSDSIESESNEHVGKSIVLENLFFATGETHLLEESIPELGKLYELMNNIPTLYVEISGHTDSKGTPEFNMELSQNRAQAVVNDIVKRGIDGSRLTAKGYGETKPIANNLDSNGQENPEGMAKNRRVELKVLELGD